MMTNQCPLQFVLDKRCREKPTAGLSLFDLILRRIFQSNGGRSLNAIVACVIFAMPCCFCIDAAFGEQVEQDHGDKMTRSAALFKESVRQVLLDNCVRCHGGEKLRGDLNLTTREGLLAGGQNGEVINLKKADASRLVKLIKHEEKPAMPAKSNRLSDDQIAAITQWIELGAAYDKPLVENVNAINGPMRVTDSDRAFWSFQSLADVTPPIVADDGWSSNAIDKFVLVKLREAGISPNGRADRRTLIRRLYYDVIGLPPTPQEVDAFVNSDDAEAYEKLVDQLLASPHYGERWARHWLDVARWGESEGFEHDTNRPNAWPYRDFVIKAFNQDMPYDQFVRWQLAGDEIAPDNPLALAATGFLGAGVFPTQLTEKEFESTRYDELDDMAHTTGTAMLGLTIGCARCHDHKYDPIPAKDYYRFVAAFATTIRTEVDIDANTPEERAVIQKEFEKRRSELKAAIATYERDVLPRRFQAFVADARTGSAKASPWSLPEVVQVQTANGTQFKQLGDGSLLAHGAAPAKDVFTFTLETAQEQISALRLEALTHESLPHRGPGRAGNGNFALGDIHITASPRDTDAPRVEVKIAAATATHQQDGNNLAVAASIDDDPVSGWAVDGQIGKDQAAMFRFDKMIGFEGGTKLTVTLRFEHPNAAHAMGRPRFAVTGSQAIVDLSQPSGPPAGIAMLIDALEAGEELDAVKTVELRDWFATKDLELVNLRAVLSTHENAGPPFKKVRAMICSEGLPHRPHHADGRNYPHFYPNVFHLNRGDPNQKGDVAQMGFIQVVTRGDHDVDDWQMSPPDGWRTSYRRRSLANWMTDTQYGGGDLLARVIVNRLWQHHFGRGIVTTPSDFGYQGDRPTHPELLDYLAGELVDNAWSLKSIHKQMLMSSAYRQSSEFDEVRAGVDIENTLLWRFNPQRLEAEAIRDAILAVSGQLDKTMYGPGSLNADHKRRSIYFLIKRSRIDPMMLLFDAPDALVGMADRNDTTVAPQALLMLNNELIRNHAAAFYNRVRKEADADDIDSIISQAFLIALGRPANEDERYAIHAFYERQLTIYDKSGRTDAALLSGIDACQTVLMLNEFIYVN